MGTVDRDYDRSYLYILWNSEQSEPLIMTGNLRLRGLGLISTVSPPRPHNLQGNLWSVLRSWLVECPVLQASRLCGGVSAAPLGLGPAIFWFVGVNRPNFLGPFGSVRPCVGLLIF